MKNMIYFNHVVFSVSFLDSFAGLSLLCANFRFGSAG